MKQGVVDRPAWHAKDESPLLPSSLVKGRKWEPTPLQSLLLASLFGPSQRRRSSFHRWASRVDFSKLEDQTFPLLPLLRESPFLAFEPELARMITGISRFNWTRNRFGLDHFRRIRERLYSRGVRSVPFKGVDLLLSSYSALGDRHLNDFDLLIPNEKLEIALDTLVGLGYHPVYPFKASLGVCRDFGHSSNFVTSAGINVDLHWRPLFAVRWSLVEEHFWASLENRSEQFGVTERLPSYLQLYVVLVNASLWNNKGGALWIADCAKLIEDSSRPLNWKGFLKIVDQTEMRNALHGPLELLKEGFGLSVPQEALFVGSQGGRGQPCLDEVVQRIICGPQPSTPIGRALTYLCFFRRTDVKVKRKYGRRAFLQAILYFEERNSVVLVLWLTLKRALRRLVMLLVRR